MLPDEMWEYILQFVDVLDLLKFECVSKHWLDIITRLIERECKWYEKCVKDVPEESWTSILEHHTHPEICSEDLHRSKKYSEIWISLYKSWIGWSKLMEKSSSTETIAIFNKEEGNNIISCLDVKSNVIAVGTGSGKRIIFYDISKFTGEPIFEAKHGAYVIGINLGRVDGDIIAVSNSCINVTDLQYWNLRTKAQIHRHVSRKYRRFLSISFEYCHMVEDGMDEDAVPYYLLKLERLGSGRDLRSVHASITEHGFINAISADGIRTIVMISPYEKTGVKIFVSEPKDELREMYFLHTNELPSSQNRTWMLFKSCVVAFIDSSEDSEFGFFINGRECKQYNVHRDLGLNFSIKCMIYDIGFLILGFESGEVLLIHVKDVNGLENLDLNTMQTKLLKLDSKPIKEVKVTEYNLNQYLVAVTKKKIHLVKFN